MKNVAIFPSIIAMYFAVVLLVGRYIRITLVQPPMEMMLSEIPNPDYLLRICHDIYLVREAGDFALEQVRDASFFHIKLKRHPF